MEYKIGEFPNGYAQNLDALNSLSSPFNIALD